MIAVIPMHGPPAYLCRGGEGLAIHH
jgi:hypothetical protein